MSNKIACVVDIGSGKISAIIGERGLSETFLIHGSSDVEYSGYMNGKFLNEEELPEVISEAITRAENNCGFKVDYVFVGVPAEFTYCKTLSAELSLGKNKKISKEHILELQRLCKDKMDYTNHTFVNISPICYHLNDSKKCINPIGEVANKIKGTFGIVVAENGFFKILNSAMEKAGVNQVEYISSALAEALYLLDPEIRDNGAVLLDIGFISTSVAIVKGEALVHLCSFSMGGGHITGDLCQCLEIPYEKAEKLKRKAVINHEAEENDRYDLPNEDNSASTSVSAQLTNNIILARIESIATLISKCLKAYTPESQNYLPIYLTGGGLCYLRGGKDALSKQLDSNIEMLAPKIPQMNRPHYSSTLGLLDVALQNKKDENIFKSVKKKLINFWGNK